MEQSQNWILLYICSVFVSYIIYMIHSVCASEKKRHFLEKRKCILKDFLKKIKRKISFFKILHYIFVCDIHV